MPDHFFLKHKNDIAGAFVIDGGNIVGEIIDKDLSPVPGNGSSQVIWAWWHNRKISESRNNLEALLKKENVRTAEEYLIKTLGLSVTDSYWIQPSGTEIRWEEVNLFDNPIKKIAVHDSHGSFDFENNPNGSLGGDQEKAWIYRRGKWLLHKKGETPDEHQDINEEFATHVHRMQGAPRHVYTEYVARMKKGRCVGSICEAFTGRDMEFVSGEFVSMMAVKPNHLSNYEHYIALCEKKGIDVREVLEYQIMTDFLLSNTDRHYNNFGILRDPETLEFISAAPIYDTANSMSFRYPYKMDRKELLGVKIITFTDREEKLLGCVRNRNRVDILATPSKEQVLEFYISRGIKEEKADAIAHNYNQKRNMLNEFVHGFSISLYHEKHCTNADINEKIKLQNRLAEHDLTVDV